VVEGGWWVSLLRLGQRRENDGSVGNTDPKRSVGGVGLRGHCQQTGEVETQV
jgi:hypothetical protein